ncbi:MAG TPA: short chain dehydrogenase [Saprospirales bacterium]|nr:short chain dehydrogenase [Saprospirales bacterium]
MRLLHKTVRRENTLLQDKKIWITGASSGIGKALAIELSNYDAYLILSARSMDKLQQTKSSLAYPDQAEIAVLDMSIADQIDSITKKILKQHGHIDILINNAGISQRSLTLETDMDVYRKLMSINYFGVIQMSKILLPSMVAMKSGHIITITSVNGKLGSYMKSGYAGSKHALHGFFDSLRAEIDGSGVDITLIAPGYVQTDISMNALTKDGTPQKSMDSNTAKGIPVEVFAKKAVKQIAKGKAEIAIAGGIESLGLYMKRFWPSLLRKLTAGRKEA